MFSVSGLRIDPCEKKEEKSKEIMSSQFEELLLKMEARLLSRMDAMDLKTDAMDLKMDRVEVKMDKIQESLDSKISVVQEDLLAFRDQVALQDEINTARFIKLEVDHDFKICENSAAISAHEDCFVELKDQMTLLEDRFEDVAAVCAHFSASQGVSQREFEVLEEKVNETILNSESFKAMFELSGELDEMIGAKVEAALFAREVPGQPPPRASRREGEKISEEKEKKVRLRSNPACTSGPESEPTPKGRPRRVSVSPSSFSDP